MQSSCNVFQLISTFQFHGLCIKVTTALAFPAGLALLHLSKSNNDLLLNTILTFFPISMIGFRETWDHLRKFDYRFPLSNWPICYETKLFFFFQPRVAFGLSTAFTSPSNKLNRQNKGRALTFYLSVCMQYHLPHLVYKNFTLLFPAVFLPISFT